MARIGERTARKPYGKMLLFGLVSIGLYALVFLNETFVRVTWAKGGVYAALPIVTVFVFSFVHGNFASYVFSVLGIEAKKKRR